jgi:hypothetical protein
VINFRYHVVSLTAVFLALAVGLVVGTAALNGPAADSLNDQVNSLRKDNQRLRDHVSHLEEDVNQKEQFASDAAPLVLAGKLTQQKVVVVTMPGAARYVDPVKQMLATSGATVTGVVQVEDKFTDPANNETLLDIASTSPAAGVSLPTNSDGVETSTALIGAMLVAHSPAAVPANTMREVLTAYSQEKFITMTGPITTQATAVVFLAGAPYTDKDAATRNAKVVTAIEQLDRVGPVVVAADGDSGDGNAITALRGDPTLARSVSTVDDLATVQGQVVTVLTCAEQIAGRVGHYGVGGGAVSLMPKLVQ